MNSHEGLKKRLPKLEFKPEGYIASDSFEYLEQFCRLLRDKGFKPEDLVFSGFDATDFLNGAPMSDHPTIYGMNLAGWRESINGLDSTPATYAEGWYSPCVGLYDKTQLTEVYSADILNNYEEDSEDRIEFGNIKLGRNLSDLSVDEPAQEELVHKNYPHSTPCDALVGLVFIEKQRF